MLKVKKSVLVSFVCNNINEALNGKKDKCDSGKIQDYIVKKKKN